MIGSGHGESHSQSVLVENYGVVGLVLYLALGPLLLLAISVISEQFSMLFPLKLTLLSNRLARQQPFGPWT